MSESMVERVARTIYLIENVGAPFLDDPEGQVERDWPNYIPEARAVLSAMRRPTEAMLSVGENDDPFVDLITCEGHCDAERHDVRVDMVWPKLIDATLSEDVHAPVYD